MKEKELDFGFVSHEDISSHSSVQGNQPENREQNGKNEEQCNALSQQPPKQALQSFLGTMVGFTII